MEGEKKPKRERVGKEVLGLLHRRWVELVLEGKVNPKEAMERALHERQVVMKARLRGWHRLKWEREIAAGLIEKPQDVMRRETEKMSAVEFEEWRDKQLHKLFESSAPAVKAKLDVLKELAKVRMEKRGIDREALLRDLRGIEKEMVRLGGIEAVEKEYCYGMFTGGVTEGEGERDASPAQEPKVPAA